jgi:hypothetical protein
MATFRALGFFGLGSRKTGWLGSSRPSSLRYRPRIEALEGRTVPSTFFVKNTNDSGPDSLRQAILSVNADPTINVVDAIDFKLPPAAPFIINLRSALPTITHQVLVDGTSQLGYMGKPIVEINGSTVPGIAGLIIHAQAAPNGFSGTIHALKIDNCATGISISDTGSSTPATINLVNNSIMSSPGGSGIFFAAGTGRTTANINSNSITTAGKGDGITIQTAGSSNNLTFTANTIHASGGGNGIRAFGGAFLDNLTFQSNTIVVQNGAKGIWVFTGVSSILEFLGNHVTTFNVGDCIRVDTAGTSAGLDFLNNVVVASGGGDGIRVVGAAKFDDLTVTSNQVFAKNKGNAMVIALSTSTTTMATIKNNVFNTNSLDIGLVLLGGPTFKALVQGNNFSNNLVGVRVQGNGTTAGDVDLGGGALGSTGGNNFKSFLAATPTSYSIGLFSVSSAYTMDAKMNLFSVSPPSTIADGSHDLGAGGKGSILT